jgi:PilZ domain
MSFADRRNLPRRPPPSGTPWMLTTPDGSTLPVSVAERGDEMLLVLLINPGDALDRLGDELSLLESMTARGIVRMRGRLERIDAELIRYRVEGDAEVIQRRQYVRVTVPQPVTLDDDSGDILEGRSVNISGGGMLVRGRRGHSALALGTEVRFSLCLDESNPPVRGVGRVARETDDPSEHALAIESISSGDQNRLIRFIFDRQRRALAQTRGDLI